MSAARIGVLALQGDVREHVNAFAACGVEAVPVRRAEELLRVDALALPGGESTTMSRLVAAFGLEQALRERLRAGIPCLATCAGMILLSRRILDGRPDQLSLGVLDLEVRRNGYGRQVCSFEATIDVPALPGPRFEAVFIRAPMIEAWGQNVEVVASLDDNPVAVAQGAHLALCFHPEMGDDPRFHRLFLERAGMLSVAGAAA